MMSLKLSNPDNSETYNSRESFTVAVNGSGSAAYTVSVIAGIKLISIAILSIIANNFFLIILIILYPPYFIMVRQTAILSVCLICGFRYFSDLTVNISMISTSNSFISKFSLFC